MNQSYSLLEHQMITFAEQLLQGSPGKRAPDLQPLRDHSGCDELVVGNFFVQFVITDLVKEDQVVQLVPHLSFGPLLLETKNRGNVKPCMHTVNDLKRTDMFLMICKIFLTAVFTFFFALPPDLLTGSLSFLDLPASFFCLVSLGG